LGITEEEVYKHLCLIPVYYLNPATGRKEKDFGSGLHLGNGIVITAAKTTNPIFFRNSILFFIM